MPRTSTLIALVSLLMVAPTLALADPPPFELAVRQDRFIGGTPGTLVIGQAGVEFQAADKSKSRHWAYLALKQIRIVSPTRIALDTYEDQGGLRFGADRVYAFDVTSTIPADSDRVPAGARRAPARHGRHAAAAGRVVVPRAREARQDRARQRRDACAVRHWDCVPDRP